MRPSVRRRVLPVARPKYFLAAPLAAWALWAIFLPMLIAGSFVFGDDRPRLRTDRIDRGVGAYRRPATCAVPVGCRPREKRPSRGILLRGVGAGCGFTVEPVVVPSCWCSSRWSRSWLRNAVSRWD